MLNESDLRTIKGVMHYLNGLSDWEADSDLTFDCHAVDPNGNVLGAISYDGAEYQFDPDKAS